MQRYLARRLLQLIPTLFVASVMIFCILQLAPGDPAVIMLGFEATPEQLEAERARLGLDKPIPVRYLIWLSDVVKLNLGRSLINGRPVVTLLANAFPNTLRLALTALVVSVVAGLAMGILSALKQNSWIDSLITAFSSLALAVPGFWLGILMILLFSVRLRWLPPSGVGDLDKGFIYDLRYLIMPVLSLAFAQAAVFSRYTRSALIDVMSADYIRTARAKGLAERAVVQRHALKNAMIPVVTIIGIQAGRLLGGAVIVEAVFAYSGMGRMVVLAIMNRDTPVVQAALMLVVCIFLLTNLVVDLLYAYLDPRVKFERAE
ncbi:MAG: ABC transporter permease [Anaerolineae bacterium]